MTKVRTAKSRSTSSADQPKATINLSIYDGRRQPFPSKDILLRVHDGQQDPYFSKYVKAPNVSIHVRFFDNFADNYTVLVTCDGYRDAGFFPVKVSSVLDTNLDLMLVRSKAKYEFLSWQDLTAQYPRYASFLSCNTSEDIARQHYEDLLVRRPQALASLLNLTAAMSVIQLPNKTPLDYFKEIEWDESLTQDRFFAYADVSLGKQVRTAAVQGEFVREPNPGLFHPDATSSFKQVQFGEANVQLTFHEKNSKKIGGVQCIKVEPDIDYYKDLGAHALLEVISNTLSHGLTDPQMVYVLRWIAGRHAGVPEFDPSYTLVP